MKKILLSISAIAIVGVIAVSATTALFSDTETSTGNTISAGTLDLKIDGGDWSGATVITVPSIVPGGAGSAVGKIKNAGSINASGLSFAVTSVSNENGCNDAEIADESACLSDLVGELCSALNVTINYDGGTAEYSGPLSSVPTLASGALDSGVEKDYSISYELPGSTTDNRVQSDNCVFTMTATLNQ